MRRALDCVSLHRGYAGWQHIKGQFSRQLSANEQRSNSKFKNVKKVFGKDAIGSIKSAMKSIYKTMLITSI